MLIRLIITKYRSVFHVLHVTMFSVVTDSVTSFSELGGWVGVGLGGIIKVIMPGVGRWSKAKSLK